MDRSARYFNSHAACATADMTHKGAVAAPYGFVGAVGIVLEYCLRMCVYFLFLYISSV